MFQDSQDYIIETLSQNKIIKKRERDKEGRRTGDRSGKSWWEVWG